MLTGNAQFDVDGTLPLGAIRAKIVRAPELNWPHHGKESFAAQLLVVRQVATRASDRPVVRIRRFELQQLRQSGGSGMVHGGTNRGLDCFQIDLPGGLTVPENDVEELTYFAGDFLLDRFGSFFSCRVWTCLSTGRR